MGVLGQISPRWRIELTSMATVGGGKLQLMGNCNLCACLSKFMILTLLPTMIRIADPNKNHFSKFIAKKKKKEKKKHIHNKSLLFLEFSLAIQGMYLLFSFLGLDYIPVLLAMAEQVSYLKCNIATLVKNATLFSFQLTPFC